jgi:hypothetical protein
MFLAFTYLDLLLPAFRGGEEEEGVMRMGALWSVLAWPFFFCYTPFFSFFFTLFEINFKGNYFKVPGIFLNMQTFGVSKHHVCQHYCVY